MADSSHGAPGTSVTVAAPGGELDEFQNPGLPPHRPRLADRDPKAEKRAERQIAATTQRSGEFGTAIAGALTDALREPLDKIAGAVGQVSQDQSSAVTQLLTDVLASFSDRLEGMFGGQLSGIGEMQQRTVDAMHGMKIVPVRLRRDPSYS